MTTHALNILLYRFQVNNKPSGYQCIVPLAYTNIGSGFLLGSPTQSHCNGSQGSHIRFRGSLNPKVHLDDVLYAIPSCVLERL